MTAPDDRADWQQYEQDRSLWEFLDALDTVCQRLDVDASERASVRKELCAKAHVPEPVPPEQCAINFDTTASLPF